MAAATAASVPDTPASTHAGTGGTLLLVDCSSRDPATLGEALGLLPYESALRHRRGGYALEAVLDPAAAEEEAVRLRAAGLVVFLVPESLTRAEPWLATGGVRETDGLRLRGAHGVRHVSGPDLRLVVKGPIVREYQTPFQRRKVQTARLEDGYRFHLHLRASPEILEIDPGDFDFEARTLLFGSSRLEMEDWIDSLAREVTVDDAFRHATPALGPGSPSSKGPLAATAALSRSAATGRESEATVHDNLRQFRFYSSWRGVVERDRWSTA